MLFLLISSALSQFRVVDKGQNMNCRHILRSFKRLIMMKKDKTRIQPIFEKICEKLPENQRATCKSMVRENLNFIYSAFNTENKSIDDVCKSLSGYSAEETPIQRISAASCSSIVDYVMEHAGDSSKHECVEGEPKFKRSFRRLKPLRIGACNNVEKESQSLCYFIVKASLGYAQRKQGEKLSSKDICLKLEKSNLIQLIE